MKRNFALLKWIASDYGISQGNSESETAFKARMLYSFIGQSGLAALWDGKDGTIAAEHFEQRIMTLMESLIMLYSEMSRVFLNSWEVYGEIYSVLLKAGCMYHTKSKVSAQLRRLSRAGKCIFIRGQAVSERVLVSGLGCYRLAESAETEKDSCSVCEMFGLSENSISHAVKFSRDGSIVKLRLENIPEAEMNFLKLYSWPCRYSEFPADDDRVMNTDIFDSIRLVLSGTGFHFEEE